MLCAIGHVLDVNGALEMTLRNMNYALYKAKEIGRETKVKR